MRNSAPISPTSSPRSRAKCPLSKGSRSFSTSPKRGSPNKIELTVPSFVCATRLSKSFCGRATTFASFFGSLCHINCWCVMRRQIRMSLYNEANKIQYQFFWTLIRQTLFSLSLEQENMAFEIKYSAIYFRFMLFIVVMTFE